MNLFPHYQHTIHTPRTPEEVRERIYARTRSRPPLSPLLCPNEIMFWGSVNWSSFQIHYENMRTWNSFTPQIQGTIVPVCSGTQINLTMTLHSTTRIFLTVYLCAALGFFLLGILLLLIQQECIPQLLLFPFVLILFSLFITHVGFKQGCRDAILLLNKLL